MARSRAAFIAALVVIALCTPSTAFALANPVVGTSYVNTIYGGLRLVTIYHRVYYSSNTSTTWKITKLEDQTYPTLLAGQTSVSRNETWLFSNGNRVYYNVCSNSHTCNYPNNIYHSWAPNKITTKGATRSYGVVNGSVPYPNTTSYSKMPEVNF